MLGVNTLCSFGKFATYLKNFSYRFLDWDFFTASRLWYENTFPARIQFWVFHSFALLLFGWGLQGECRIALFLDTSCTPTPLFVTFISLDPIFATTFMELEFLTFFICVWNNFFSPLIVFFFFHFVQLSIVMQPLLSPPQPPFPDLPEFLSGIITFFQDFFQQFFQDFSEESSLSFGISFKHCFRFLWGIITIFLDFFSTILSGFLWGIITFFRDFFLQLFQDFSEHHCFLSAFLQTIFLRNSFKISHSSKTHLKIQNVKMF